MSQDQIENETKGCQLSKKLKYFLVNCFRVVILILPHYFYQVKTSSFWMFLMSKNDVICQLNEDMIWDSLSISVL